MIKMDLEKTYDRLEWKFIEETLIDASIPDNLIGVTMEMLRRSSCRLMWNGEATEAIKPTRGLRQGDLLSPYLFIMCMERLSRWVHQRVEEGNWRPLKASRGGPVVSHLFFADDILLFVEAIEMQVDRALKGINEFSAASGQKVNLSKSSVLFSSNLSEQVMERLNTRMGIKRTRDLGKYLGHQILHHGRNNQANKLLLERVQGRLDGWKSRCLSKAGRLTLAKSVINTMGVFQMQVRRPSTSVHKALSRL